MRTMSAALTTLMFALLCVLTGAGCDPAEAEPGLLDADIDEPALCDEAGRIYVSEAPEVCRALLFICEPGLAIFNDDCGCGCAPLPMSSDPDADVELVSAEVP